MADKLERAKQSFEDAKSFHAEQHSRMREDLEFSNPSCPRQWDDETVESRRLAKRPYLTFDYTNQYIMQVVNDQRMNKPGIQILPVGSGSDIEVAHTLEGLFRHIEYASRAGIAYDTSIEHAARVGLGWLRVVPEIVDPETNEQEIRIKRVVNPLSVMLDANSTEPDGSDAIEGHVETTYTEKAFKRAYPKAKIYGSDTGGWYGKDSVRACEHFEVVTKKQNRLIVQGPEGERMTLSEDEYWQLAKQVGFKPEVIGRYIAEVRSVEWIKYCGDEIFEETTFPAPWIPLIPVLGYELWVDDTRYVCGLTRRMMDQQVAYNIARTAETEMVSKSPKQPWLVNAPSVAAHQQFWENSDNSNAPYLPWEAYDTEGRLLPEPKRQMPAQVSPGYLQLAQASLGDMEASVGMYRANLGQTSNETSGKAINARARQGSIANYHYVDNQARAIEQLGRVIISMIPKIYDTQRIIQIIGEDGTPDQAKINPGLVDPVEKRGAKIVAINPNIGSYDVRVKVGPAYATQRQEVSEALSQIMQGNPAMGVVLGPIWAKMQDFPDADKVARMLMALAPPQVQQAASEEGAEIPPEVAAQMQQLEQQSQQAQEVIQQLVTKLQEAEQQAQGAQAEAQMKYMAQLQVEREKQQAETQRVQMQIMADLRQTSEDNQTKKDVEELKQVFSLIGKGVAPPPVVANEVTQDIAQENSQ